ncbi:hypothetical protein Corgl_0851 [Coriobacterium glomerans PW2]|uniref:DZANK-type domain-containing protein n=1 Tax=Coriobacterium glomerans (strain ATCC 49209 / DSM 20642 / JCM 10262 / PW2) TaxID=700015 RepID=F2N7S2_CORGP|nr:hypothetical protein Corgl_0851 [Coriobacterium glomerans PW2]
MICPHCLKSIDDNASVCPGCGSYISAHEQASHIEFVFCEGCGARLSPHDRTCPKCGRPAPGILSAKAAASDLAAGRTASFPRVSPLGAESEHGRFNVVDTETAEPQRDPLEAAPVFDDADADATAQPPVRRPRRRGIPRRLIAAAVVTALLALAAVFVVRDPLGVMPGIYGSVRSAARDMFPSRQADGDEQGSSEESKGEKSGSQAGHETALLDDNEAYTRLSGIYQRLGAYQDRLAEAINEYNGGFIAKDRAKREAASKPAYAMRDSVKQTIDEINGLKLSETSAFLPDVEHMRSLATWMYERIDVLCHSWDISLSVAAGDLPLHHKNEILQPLRDALDKSGKNQSLVMFETNYAAWKPHQPTS